MKKNKLTIFILTLIILISSYLRLSGTFTNSFAFTYDVGRDMLKISEMISLHKIPLIGFTTGVEGIFYGPWWYYILFTPFLISGGNPQFIAAFIALTGIITILLLFILGKKLEGNKFGLLLAFLAGFSPELIGTSTQIWNPNLAPILIATSLFLVLKIIKNPTPLTFFFFGIISSLLIDTEIVFGLLLLLGNTIGLFAVSRKTILTRKSLLFIPGFLLILAPRIIFELRHELLMTKTFFHVLSSQGQASTGITLPAIIEKLNIFLGLYAGTITGRSTIVAGILLILMIFFFLIYYKKFKTETRKFFYLSSIITITFVIGIIFFSHDIWPHYLVGLPVYFCLLTAIPIYYATKKIKFGHISLALLLFGLFWINVKPIQAITDLQKPLWEGDASVYRNQLAVVDYIYNEASGKRFEITTYSPAVFAYPYDYLFSWYGPKKYHYARTLGHEKLFFIIIEPNPQYPTLLKDWLKTREKDGKIIKEQKVKGGIIVQTREH
jgi:hypothetical protein